MVDRDWKAAKMQLNLDHRAVTKIPVCVIYASGEGKSGNTLLDRILGPLKGVSSFNEIYELREHGFLENGKPACGQTIKYGMSKRNFQCN
jgi:hypothetical protein